MIAELRGLGLMQAGRERAVWSKGSAQRRPWLSTPVWGSHLGWDWNSLPFLNREFSGWIESDVHWGYGVLTHGQVAIGFKGSHQSAPSTCCSCGGFAWLKATALKHFWNYVAPIPMFCRSFSGFTLWVCCISQPLEAPCKPATLGKAMWQCVKSRDPSEWVSCRCFNSFPREGKSDPS